MALGNLISLEKDPRINRYFVLAVAFLSTLASAYLPSIGIAQVVDPKAQLCPVMLDHFYFSRTQQDYVATLSAPNSGDYSGSITLFGDKEVYEVTFDKLHIEKTAPLSIRMAAVVRIDYASMDTGAKAGAAATSCPTFVIFRGNDTDEGALAPAGLAVSATDRGAMPALPCGKIFEPPQQLPRKTVEVFAGLKNADVRMKMLVDSDGHVFGVQILKSGGDITVDGVAENIARTERFRPAQFLCAPVISEFLIDLSYDAKQIH